MKKSNRPKLVKYAQTLYWALCTQIESYRMLDSQVNKGSLIAKNNIGNVVDKLNSGLKLSGKVPLTKSFYEIA